LSAILLVPRHPVVLSRRRFLASLPRIPGRFVFSPFPHQSLRIVVLPRADIVVVVVCRLIFFVASSGVTDAETVTIRGDENQRNTGISTSSMRGMSGTRDGDGSAFIRHDRSAYHSWSFLTRKYIALAGKMRLYLAVLTMFLNACANIAVSDGIIICLAISGSWLCKKQRCAKDIYIYIYICSSESKDNDQRNCFYGYRFFCC